MNKDNVCYGVKRIIQTTKEEVSKGSKSSKSGTKDELTEVEKKMKTLEEMRKHFYDYNFPFPPITRQVGWVILVLWSCAAVIVAVCCGALMPWSAVLCWHLTVSLKTVDVVVCVKMLEIEPCSLCTDCVRTVV